jgi:hypothetical protein
MVEHVPELLDLILFLANDVSVVHIFRYKLTCGTLSNERVLASIVLIMTNGVKLYGSNLTLGFHLFELLSGLSL